MEQFFLKHGSFSTLTSHLIPGVRQFISLPAGLSNMPMRAFLVYTTIGAIILALLCYFIGGNEAILKEKEY